jgi:hypothetical protein
MYHFTGSYTAYCDMATNGGGWMLLLTQTDASANFAGSVVPFRQTSGSPSTSAVYARDWSSTGVGLLPAAGDQIMIVRQSDGDYVTMTLTTWCPGASWESTSAASCGGSGHAGYAAGTVTRGASATSLGTMNFNGCSHGGGCYNGGGDGVGFSTNSGWAHGVDNCFGGCYASDGRSGAHFHWAGTSVTPDVLSYYYKPA